MLALILAGIGTFGIAGFIALAIFAPPIAAALAKGALEIVSKLWQTRLGMAAMVGTAAFLAGASLGDWKGAARVQARWDAANAAAAAKARAADNEAAQKAEATDRRDTAAEATDDTTNQGARNAYIADLEKRAAAVCTLNDADLKRLRDIR